MGRIHRIGQRNEVFVFNLVAANTREGDVMLRLLTKLEQMREDLGADSVYDFIGEVLEDRYYDLPSFMQQAILNRETLDDIIAGMEKTLSEEHKRLLQIYHTENLANDALELTGLRKEQHELMVKHIPTRCYAEFCKTIFEHKRIRFYEAKEERIVRIERMPKFIRDFARKNKIILKDSAESYKFTGYAEQESENVDLVDQDHALYKLGLELARVETEKFAFQRYMVKYPCKEILDVSIYKLIVIDGTGKELSNELIYVAQRGNGELVVLDNYWLFQFDFADEIALVSEKADTVVLPYVYKVAAELRTKLKTKREKQLEKVSGYLTKTFQLQYNDVIDKLFAYQQDNQGNRNSILINQMNAKLIDIEIRKEERLSEVERQRNVVMKPPKRIAQLELLPNGLASRVFPEDHKGFVEHYERQHGRSNFKVFAAFALVDYYSERYNGEPRFIIVQEKKDLLYSREYYEDLRNILDYTYIYYIDKSGMVTEYSIKDHWMMLFQ
ncbi:MAG: helicase [Firmicutes bacterium]|nr:helicase [Bacillota bacterium]